MDTLNFESVAEIAESFLGRRLADDAGAAVSELIAQLIRRYRHVEGAAHMLHLARYRAPADDERPLRPMAFHFVRQLLERVLSAVEPERVARRAELVFIHKT